MRLCLLSVPVSILLCTSTALAQTPFPWSDNFDSYPAGLLGTQGGWEEWTAGAGAVVRDATTLPVAITPRSAPNCLAVGQAVPGITTLETDAVHQYGTPLNPGVYDNEVLVYTAYQYIPTGSTGQTYFILLSTYNAPAGPYTWSVQLMFDCGTGMIQGDCGGNNNWTVNNAIVYDAWVPIKVILDLAANTCQITYDDGAIACVPYSWTGGVWGNGAYPNVLAAVDLYANNASTVYYDDISTSVLEFERVGSNPPSTQGPITYNMVIPPSATVGAMVTTWDGMPNPAHFHIIGLSNASAPTGPLPFDLTQLGAPGFNVYVSPDVAPFSVGSPSANGFSGAMSITIPTHPAFVNLRLHIQIAYLDPTLNSLGVGLSDAWTTAVGQ